MRPRIRLIPAILTAALAVALCAAVFGNGEDAFTVKRIGNIHSYADNAFQIDAAESGTLEIRIHDNICVYRVLRQEVEAGETVIHWDGCGYNREKLYEKTYTVTAELTAGSGQVYTVSFDSPVEYPAQCLQYALPSSEVMYLDRAEDWFLEFRTVTKGTVAVSVRSGSNPEENYDYTVAAGGGKISRKTFPELAGRKKIPPAGEYSLLIYEISRPDEIYEYPLRIESSAPAPEPVTVTGEILPDRAMSDTELWELMMKPSVVIDIDSFKHQDVLTDPNPESKSLGTLHGQSQGVRVLRIEEEWALIGAWNHEEAAYIEGWVPLSRLKTEAPRGEYALLIDKRKQTLTVFRNGEVLDTLLISTGRAEKGSLYQETSAGCFLTGYHRVNFSMNGKKYDYVIQYDGGNLLHQTPYDWGQQKKDFTLGRGYLGTKASHACIRIQPEPGDGGLNAYWLFTHLPYHTRVMILDDPWERESAAEILKRGKNDEPDMASLRLTGSISGTSGENVEITFAGALIPGGERSFNQRKESFASFCGEKGYGSVLGSLAEIFGSDDMTCISLGCVFQKEPDSYPDQKGTVYAPAGTWQVFENASIELVQMTDDRLAAGGTFGSDTAGLVRSFTGVLTRSEPVVFNLKGHLFGFAGCAESEYMKDPGIIDDRISELKAAGCERIIMLFSWSDSREQQHTIVHEAMAHRGVRAGADLVVGNGRGTVRGIDYMEDVPVVYSTGDLLNGSISAKPKSQQGIIVRASFSFDCTENGPALTVIPILPYGSTETASNEYCPAAGLTRAQGESVIRNIWQDASYAALQKVLFYLEDQ